MELGFVRGLITVILLVLFIGVWFFSWSKQRSKVYDAASHLPLQDDSRPPTNNNAMEQHS